MALKIEQLEPTTASCYISAVRQPEMNVTVVFPRMMCAR